MEDNCFTGLSNFSTTRVDDHENDVGSRSQAVKAWEPLRDVVCPLVYERLTDSLQGPKQANKCVWNLVPVYHAAPGYIA